MASINGIAHIQLTVSDMKRSVPFYRTLLQSLEMITLRDTPEDRKSTRLNSSH